MPGRQSVPRTGPPRYCFKSIFSNAVSLFRAGGDCDKVILSPLPRFLRKGCCKDETHATNRKDKFLAVQIGNGLNDIRSWIKELAFGKRIRNFKVLCPIILLEGETEDVFEAATRMKPYWASDPVHLSRDGYSALASSLLDTMVNLTYTRSYTVQETELPQRGAPTTRGSSFGRGSRSGNAPVQGSQNYEARRASWVSCDEATAERAHSSTRGGWRPSRGYKGLQIKEPFLPSILKLPIQYSNVM
jgi:hypothetical protein